ncbi:HAD-IIIC family phosphatase [Butyrivibrio sp. XPD2002]|uniref:HAD-IIIC family phosphatase n=1 Tax=Butyrivibrio sp. XPD2002 TaxID=1280665 RepID=UPI000417F665|nr:HAD-IIIC family phosphatase [Butyrivibrio sp. XPD2002]
MKELDYPFDSEDLLTRKRAIRKAIRKETEGLNLPEKKIAVLGGSTTHGIIEMLELFLLNKGIKPVFYESEYNMYWEDVMFDAGGLSEFGPDIIFIHTSTRNIRNTPNVKMSDSDVDEALSLEYDHYEKLWEKIREKYGCPVIQNNFEQPFYRLLGNSDVVNIHGLHSFVQRLNAKFYEYARSHENFFINDIAFLAASYGLQKWSDPYYYHMYKYIMCVPAIPEFAYNLANIIGSIYGKNKKAFALDLDNTLWGGIVGDDGPENIEIGQETPKAQLYSEFQKYIKAHRDIGVLLTVDSKNEEENAIAGLKRPDSILTPDDFSDIKANWDPKDLNLKALAKELNIGEDAFVFVDDNPAERHIVREQIGGAAVPELSVPEHYISEIDRGGYFEVTSLSEDDLKRNDMYKANAERGKLQESFADYSEYLKSLEMKAHIAPFEDMYMARIAQLTNKSNQFNLTTRRCSQAEIEAIAADDKYITLYGALSDRFGDNGVVSVAFGHVDEKDAETFHIDLWLMSCRVLKRDMEYAMMDKLIEKCNSKGIKRILGYYYPTAKNKMVENFYELQGFEKITEADNGDLTFELELNSALEGFSSRGIKNKVITVE